MMGIQTYFELERKNFTLDIARSAVKAWVDKYRLKKVDIEKEASKLYNDGNGGGILFTNLPYNALIIEVQSSKRYNRIPSGKLYVYMSCDRTNFKSQKQLEQYIDDSVVLYYILKPTFGACDYGDSFESDGTHFLRGPAMYSIMFFGPRLVSSIGLGKFLALHEEVYQVKRLNEGGVLLWLSEGEQWLAEGEQEERAFLLPGSNDLEEKVAQQLGIKSR
ncbi:MAG: hypothetical protein AABX69_03380 [Nanoarchaeota archaeon]